MTRYRYIVLVLFFVVGVVILISGFRAWYQADEARSWPSVPGTLTRCEIKQFSNRRGAFFKVEAAYDYSVAGKPFTGTRVAFGYDSNAHYVEAEQLRAELKRAAGAVDVHYSPADPSLCTLQVGDNKSIMNTMLFALIWLVTIGFFIFMTRRAAPIA